MSDTIVDLQNGIPGFRKPIRQHTRRATAWAARLRTGGSLLPCRVVDISDGGAGVNVYDASEELSVGDAVELEMLGAGLEWQQSAAFVRHVTPIAHGLHVGVEFASELASSDSYGSLGMASALNVDTLAH